MLRSHLYLLKFCSVTDQTIFAAIVFSNKFSTNFFTLAIVCFSCFNWYSFAKYFMDFHRKKLTIKRHLKHPQHSGFGQQTRSTTLLSVIKLYLSNFIVFCSSILPQLCGRIEHSQPANICFKFSLANLNLFDLPKKYIDQSFSTLGTFDASEQ